MPDRNVQVIRIIVGNRLPVERPVAQPHRRKRLHLRKAVRLDLVFVRRHDLGDRRHARLERHEQETSPIFERDGKQAELFGLQSWIFLPVRNPDELAVPGIAPGMIRAGQDLRAAGVAVDQPRTAVAAHVRESADFLVIPADDDHTLAQIFQHLPVAGFRDVAFMADDLRRSAKESLLLGLEEFRVVIEPSGQAHVVERIVIRRDAAEMRRHSKPLPFRRLCGNGRLAGARPCRCACTF